MKTKKENLKNQNVSSVHLLVKPKYPANEKPIVNIEGKEQMPTNRTADRLKLIKQIEGLLERIETAAANKIKSILEKLKAGLGSYGYGYGYYGSYPEPEMQKEISEAVLNLQQSVDDISESISDKEIDEIDGENIKENLRTLCSQISDVSLDELVKTAETNAIFESLQIDSPSGNEPDGSIWDVTVIVEGISVNRLNHRGENFDGLCKLIEGTKVYSNHIARDKQKYLPERDIREAVGWLQNCKTERRDKDGKRVIKAKLHFVPSAKQIGSDLLHAFREGKNDYLGLSLHAIGPLEFSNVGGMPVRDVKDYSRVFSVDIVTQASAGGEFVAPLLESINEGMETMKKIEELTPEEFKKLRPDLFAEQETDDQHITESETGDQQTKRDKSTTELIELKVDMALEKTKIPEVAKSRIRESIIADESITSSDQALDRIKDEVKFFGDLESSLHKDEDDKKPIIEGVKSRIEKLTDAWLSYFGPGQNHLHWNVRDLWRQTTGDDSFNFKNTPRSIRLFAEASNYMRDIHVSNIREGKTDLIRGWSHEMETWSYEDVIAEVTRTNWAAYFGDIIHQSILQWSKVEPASIWKRDIDIIATKKRLEDFEDDDHYIMTGLDALDIVVEDNPYTAFAGGDSIESTSFTPSKRGNTFSITREMMLGDRIGLIQQIPRRIAQVAWFTLWNFVYNTSITANPNMSYDGNPLFDIANHSNRADVALSGAALIAAIQRMRAQTLPGAAATYPMRLAPVLLYAGPKNIELLDELVFAKNKVLNPATAPEQSSTLPNFFGRYGFKDYIVLDHLTVGGADEDKWFVTADPGLYEVFILGFVQGREDPEIITQDNPQVGEVFSHDRITWKVRHEYGGSAGRHEYFDGSQL